ncbi:MAG TPA: hypothetical protein VGK74_12925 [Symbiobacteriaceae bacterium]|jgi:hypothetical protein
MRRLILPAAALLVLAAATPALASAGLPKIASVEVGGYKVAIHDDSFSAKTGANTFTVEIGDFPAGHTVHLKLVGPQAQVVAVPLQDLLVLEGPDDGHGDSADMANMPGMADMPGMDGHDTASSGHDSGSTGHGGTPDAHDTANGGQAYTARGKAVLDAPGTWKVVVKIDGDHDGPVTAEAPIDVHPGGPAPLYLGFTGVSMGGFLTYGIVRRRNERGAGR